MNDDNEKKVPLGQYTGAIIGGVIALILCFTRVYRLLLYIVIILAGIFIGNYVQNNKEKLK